MRGLFIWLLAFMALQNLALCQNEQALRRRRIRKKVIKAPIVENESTILEDIQENIQQQVAEDDRNGRGFLDDYYSQFDDRVSQSHVDNTNSRMDAYSTDYDKEENISDQQARDMPNDYMPNDYSAYQQMQMEALLRQKKENLEAQLIQKHMEEERLEEELKSLPTTIQQQQPDIRSATRYVQHVALPNSRPDETAYMYSSVMADDPNMNEILPAKSMTNYMYAKPPSDIYAKQGSSLADTLSTAENQMYTTSIYGAGSDSSDYNSDPDISRFFNNDNSPSTSYLSDSGSSNSDAVSRFFGVTGTTSQDIQLGLTFTVPFLSVPLQSLQSMIGGGGLGDLFDNFSLDSSSVITIVVVAVAAIFVLPQMIYWLTGVNLSAFNWGRMDEGNGMNIASVMNMVDEAMKKYDVDTRSCMARTMCNQYASKTLPAEEEAVQRISRGLIENIAHHDYIKKYLGESKVEEALKYGQNGKDCSIYYSRDVCPWDTSAMIKIATKVMTSGNIDFASIASAAAANLISSTMSKN